MLFFWMGCFTNTPSVPTSTVDVHNPNTLGCAPELQSKKDGIHSYCWDPQNKRIHGSSVYSLPDGIISFQYSNGAITRYQLKETQRTDTEQYLFEFLRPVRSVRAQVLSIVNRSTGKISLSSLKIKDCNHKNVFWIFGFMFSWIMTKLYTLKY